MEFTLKDRLVLVNILPKEGDFITLTLSAELKEKIAIKAKEIEKYEIKTNGNALVWNEDGTKATFKFELTDSEKETVKNALNKLNEDKKLTEDHLSLYKIFCK